MIETYESWITPLLFLAGGLLLGFIAEKIILTKLSKFFKKTAWKGDEIIADALRSFVWFWFFLASAYGAVRTSEISIDERHIIQKILLIITILSITAFAAKLTGKLVRLYSSRSTGLLPSASIFSNLSKIFVLLIGLLIILNSLGISITPALAALGVGGLAVALALQEPLQNVFSGLQLLASHQIRPGDYIKLEGDEEGYVIDITWRSTSIRTLPGNVFIIPNYKLATSMIKNYDLPNSETAVLMQMGVSYNSNLQHCEKVTIEVAKELLKEVNGGVPDFEPLVRYHTFGESSINFTLVLRGRHITDQHLLKHEIIKRIIERYKKESIEIPFPIRTVYIKN
ncbi:MAG TPA: mechanosensitive ion channel family protein [Acidobacteriota bacterium]